MYQIKVGEMQRKYLQGVWENALMGERNARLPTDKVTKKRTKQKGGERID